MKIGVGEINTRMLMQMAWNDKEKMMEATDENEQNANCSPKKNLDSLAWDIYNMTQVLVSVVEVYPEFKDEINNYFQTILGNMTVRAKSVANRLPCTLVE